MDRKLLFIVSLAASLIISASAFGGEPVSVDNRGVAHKSSNGTTIAFPDVCKTPSPAGPVPIPYPHSAMSSDTAQGSKKVKMDGKAIMLKSNEFSTSSGDEPGVGSQVRGTHGAKPKGTILPRTLRRK